MNAATYALVAKGALKIILYVGTAEIETLGLSIFLPRFCPLVGNRRKIFILFYYCSSSERTER